MSSPLFHDWELQLSSSYVQQALAFPTTPACFHNFYWNATCWIKPVRPDIRFGGPCVQLYEFGGPERYHDPDGFSMPREVRLLLAFPYLEDDIFEEARLRKWMNQVVIPAVFQSLPASTSQYFHHSSVEMIRLNSQAARVEGMRDVPDTQLDFYLQTEQLESAWKEIQRTSEMPGFEEFRGVRPVILANYGPLRFHETSPEAAFQKFLGNWNSTMRMQYIPRDGVYIEFNTDGHLHPEVAPPDVRMTPQLARSGPKGRERQNKR
ncbi:hypothetical protein LTR20_009215 [Exophiala xenobiotica]|nr:hypothetical protein LTR79_005346 [Exophiala xenobiotica]KAK5456798.1 hypothetical protein LTR20_009215 [Exophiala xenobiotica]KAK5473619.1 hypothetical protein LTR26_010338 [Exophiala xenobiotica]KAK5482772.1 hypothetical protein LTR83_009588 [Exophiala xenobiotica]KAK5508624.1 hypothetical protein LTR21_008422 [Exophiala xenobiotica]